MADSFFFTVTGVEKAYSKSSPRSRPAVLTTTLLWAGPASKAASARAIERFAIEAPMAMGAGAGAAKARTSPAIAAL